MDSLGVTKKALEYLEERPCYGLSNLLGPLALRISREAAPPAGWSQRPFTISLTLKLQDVGSSFNSYTAFGAAGHAAGYRGTECFLKRGPARIYNSTPGHISPPNSHRGPSGDTDEDSLCWGVWEHLTLTVGDGQ